MKSQRAAAEIQQAMHLQEVEWQSALYQNEKGRKLVRRMLKEMEYHKEDCAHLQGAWIATRTGECWHLRACSTLSGTPEEHLRWYRRCTVCMENLPPPDREDRFFGGTIADDIQAWLAGP